MGILTLPLNNGLANFNYLVYCEHTRNCLVVDPLDVTLIRETAQAESLQITHIVNTHEHGDHTGGNLELKAATGAKVLAHFGASELIPGFDQGLKAGDTLTIGKSLTLKILDTPGHTLHHLCFWDEANKAIFTGDTLFNCGCGNCYHGGDPEVMFHTFESQLQHLPDETRLYPGHDYLRNNLAFARSFQPALASPSLEPGEACTLKEDKRINPFFRLDDPELIQALRSKTSLSAQPSRKEVFLALRTLRNHW